MYALPPDYFEKLERRITYSTNDKKGTYSFLLWDKDGLYTLEIESMPSYGIRDDDPAKTFRRIDEDGRMFIEVLNPEKLDSKEKALEEAKRWAEFNQAYIETDNLYPETENENYEED